MEYLNIDYEPVGWKDYPSTTTKLNAENLNKPDGAIVKIITAIKEIRNLLGSVDLTQGTDIISVINSISGKYGGYQGYNLLDISNIQSVSNGFHVDASLSDLGMEAGVSYTLSYEGTDDVYFYEYDADGAMLSTEILSDTSQSLAFTVAADCESIRVFFPKTAGFISESLCYDAHVMLEKGTEKHDYEPYTGGEPMTDLWEEILENQQAVKACNTSIATCKSNIEECQDAITAFIEALEGAY